MRKTNRKSRHVNHRFESIEQMWERACKDIREAKAQKQRALEAMLRAGSKVAA